jgi:hypothetical protein
VRVCGFSGRMARNGPLGAAFGWVDDLEGVQERSEHFRASDVLGPSICNMKSGNLKLYFYSFIIASIVE